MEEVQKKMERNKEEQKALGMVIQNVKRRKTATKDPTNRKSGLAVSSLSSTAGNGPDAGGQVYFFNYLLLFFLI